MQLNQINPDCKDCKLHSTAKAVCLKGRSLDNSQKKLMVFTDHPDYFADNAKRPYAQDSGQILDWMFKRMSVNPADVSYEYTLRCYPAKSLPTTKAERAECIVECNQYRFATIAKHKPKSIATLGQVSLEAFTGKTKIGDYEGNRIKAWEPAVARYTNGIWISYSLVGILLFAGDTPRVFRTLFCAAGEAGLKPKLDPTIPPFKWPNIL